MTPVPAKTVIIALRSTPMLPKKYAVNPTSRQHYEDFSRGPLSAYLHLCSEQDVPDMVGVFEAAGQKTGRTDDDLRHVLGAFKMDFPVATDAGARQSVDDLLRDADAARPFTVRTNIGPLLAGADRRIGGGIEGSSRSGSDDRRGASRRDRPARSISLRSQHFALWRTKQASDGCSGSWAQCSGPAYNKLGDRADILKIHKARRDRSRVDTGCCWRFEVWAFGQTERETRPWSLMIRHCNNLLRRRSMDDESAALIL